MLVSYDKPNVHKIYFSAEHVEPITFIPGVNVVDPKAWKEAQAHPDVKKMLSDGVLKVESTVEASEEKSGLADMAIKDACAVIKKTLNLNLLEEWKLGETRSAVLKDLDKQIKDINEKTKPSKSKDKE